MKSNFETSLEKLGDISESDKVLLMKATLLVMIKYPPGYDKNEKELSIEKWDQTFMKAKDLLKWI